MDRPTVLPSAPARDISIDFEGRRVPAVAGEPVAVALLRDGQRTLSRSVKYHRPRGPFCLAGECGSCLMRIGDEPDRLACATPCRDGLAVAAQNALPTASRDLLRAIDWAFPEGMDPHGMLAGVPVADAVMAKVARQLAGLGELPARVAPPAENPPERRVDVCVVGLGRAGGAALAAASAAGRSVLGIDAERGERALGVYRDGGAPLLAIRREGAVQRVRPGALVLCTGGRDQNALFDDNDLPGIHGGRGVLGLLRRHRLLPSRSALVLGDGPDALPLCRELLAAGAEVTWAGERVALALSDLERLAGFQPRAAHGRSRVRGMTLVSRTGEERRWSGGLVAVCGPRAAAFELGGHCGATARYLPGRGYALHVGEGGATNVSWLWAAGSCTDSALDSELQGAQAGAAAARSEKAAAGSPARPRGAGASPK